MLQDRSLALSPGERAVKVRAWAGKALAFMQLGDLDEAVLLLPLRSNWIDPIRICGFFTRAVSAGPATRIRHSDW